MAIFPSIFANEDFFCESALPSIIFGTQNLPMEIGQLYDIRVEQGQNRMRAAAQKLLRFGLRRKLIAPFSV